MKKITVLFIFLLSVFIGCLKDNPLKELGDFNSAEEFLTVIETKRSFITSAQFPFQMTAAQVYSEINNLNIIDLRSQNDFKNGHIKGAINYPIEKLPEIINKLDTVNKKTVFVCATGETSQFAAALYRIAGKNNFFFMRWGMAAWNEKFIEPWVKNRKNFINVGRFTREEHPKNPLGKLPYFVLEGNNYDDKINKQLNNLLLNKGSKFIITIEEIFNNQNLAGEFPDYYLICFGSRDFYCCRGIENPGHPKTTVLFSNKTDFLSYNFLTTIPPNKKIVVYDMDGQSAPAIAAYLNFLGFDAYSIFLGGNSMVYEQLMIYSFFSTLRVKDIMNYPFEIGG